MRVPKTWVPVLTRSIVRNLVDKGLVHPKVSEEKLLAEAEDLIMEELMVEDRLSDEIRELLKKHETDIERGRMDYRKLFEMTKQRLVKERNLVL